MARFQSAASDREAVLFREGIDGVFKTMNIFVLLSSAVWPAEVETLLRVNWEQQYTARLSPFVLTQTVPLRPSDPLYFPPPGAISEQSLTAAATAASSVLSPRAARAAATALAAAALARRDHVYSQKCLDTAQALQDTALVATGHVTDEFILDSAVSDEPEQREGIRPDARPGACPAAGCFQGCTGVPEGAAPSSGLPDRSACEPLEEEAKALTTSEVLLR